MQSSEDEVDGSGEEEDEVDHGGEGSNGRAATLRTPLVEFRGHSS